MSIYAVQGRARGLHHLLLQNVRLCQVLHVHQVSLSFSILFTDFFIHSPDEAFKLLILANELGLHFATLMSLFLNLCLCVDLVLTLWSPFNVTRNRIIWYTIFSIIISLSLVIVIFAEQDIAIYT